MDKKTRIKPAEAVLKFLNSIGHESEASFYLKLFQSEEKQRFAIIAVERSVLQQATDAVALDLSFLNALDLLPVVVLGLHEPSDAMRNARNLQKRLQDVAVKSVILNFAEPTSTIVKAVKEHTLPLLIFDESDSDTRFLWLSRLLSSLQTRKLIFLEVHGGLIQKGKLLSLVNLSKDYSLLRSSQDLSEREKNLLKRSHQLIFDRDAHRMLIAITSPFNLLHELFTEKGAGTLLRKGSTIGSYLSYDDVDVSRLYELFSDSFGRPMKTDLRIRPVSRIYVEENYRGAAILLDTPLGGYLTKFAVTREAQGEGIGHDLWQEFTKDFNVFFWRARPTNRIRKWYQQQCEGWVTDGPWTIYFKGLGTQRIPEAVQFALQQPIDF